MNWEIGDKPSPTKPLTVEDFQRLSDFIYRKRTPMTVPMIVTRYHKTTHKKVQAAVWDGDHETRKELRRFITAPIDERRELITIKMDDDTWVSAEVGDWIISHGDGTYEILNNTSFQEWYEIDPHAEEFTPVAPDDPFEADVRESITGKVHLDLARGEDWSAIAADADADRVDLTNLESGALVRLASRFMGDVGISFSDLIKWRAQFKREEDQLEQIPAELFQLIDAMEKALGKISAMSLVLDQVRHDLANEVMKCGYCGGSGQDNDGEALLNQACPECAVLRRNLASIDELRKPKAVLGGDGPAPSVS